jgi:hypothetical protein
MLPYANRPLYKAPPERKPDSRLRRFLNWLLRPLERFL